MAFTCKALRDIENVDVLSASVDAADGRERGGMFTDQRDAQWTGRHGEGVWSFASKTAIGVPSHRMKIDERALRTARVSGIPGCVSPGVGKRWTWAGKSCRTSAQRFSPTRKSLKSSSCPIASPAPDRDGT